MRSVQFGSRRVGDNQPILVIAEIGINHNGDLANALQLIDIATAAGCEMVKFQKRTVDVVYTAAELAQARVSPWGTTNGQLKYHLEFGHEEYREIDERCRKNGILWCASPWDVASVAFLNKFGVACHKVASACVTDVALLQAIAESRKPVIMSTGMSTLDELDRAVGILAKKGIVPVLLHTVSTYPSKPDEINLRVMDTLRLRYPKSPIGYSGHEDGIVPSLAAAAMGACMIERHFTISKQMFGSDQKASIEPREMQELVTGVRCIEAAFGSPEKVVLPSELPVREKLRRFK